MFLGNAAVFLNTAFGPCDNITFDGLDLEKVASLVPPEKLTRISESAARAQGMELRVFTTLPDAVDWLRA